MITAALLFTTAAVGGLLVWKSTLVSQHDLNTAFAVFALGCGMVVVAALYAVLLYALPTDKDRHD